MAKPIRYIVYIPNQEIPVSYNTSFGKDNFGIDNALKWAKITAKLWYGGIVEEGPENEFREIKNYHKDKNLIK